MSGGVFVWAWRLLRRVPEAAVRSLFVVVGLAAWALRGTGVRRLEANLARVRPHASPRELRALSRAGMRSYMRYYGEIFILDRLPPERVAARVRTEHDEQVRNELAAGRGVVLALGHLGNWDLAGAWATRNLAPTTTVAERLEPREVFEQFLELRTRAGLTIIAVDEPDVFRRLVRAVRAGELVPLLADRDLSASGVTVEMFGAPARVAAGPAALALSTGRMLIPTAIVYERLRGARRRAAGSPWGVVVRFLPAVPVPQHGSRAEQVQQMSQAWVDALTRVIAERPEDWHMLQRVFVADLDPERDAAVRGTA